MAAFGGGIGNGGAALVETIDKIGDLEVVDDGSTCGEGGGDHGTLLFKTIVSTTPA